MFRKRREPCSIILVCQRGLFLRTSAILIFVVRMNYLSRTFASKTKFQNQRIFNVFNTNIFYKQNHMDICIGYLDIY